MSLENEDERSLMAKLNESAASYMDKKYILDARDKLIRLKQNRQTDLATAVAVVGTCPDMCPEQERYFRIETKQISAFELDYSQDGNGVPDETRMVKEYRRSGADQKDPLPYELRPIHVLEHTMTYLCLQIIDQYETYPNIGEWFDFIWSRTRSIRKDITQQHLINLQSVALIEKCARFHIFCSYYLCEEEVRDFDPKINEENLSNCLQTLKDFYYDLSIRSIYCQNESEFRAYDILLNLRNGETLSELKHFRKEIRNTPEVKFAVQIYQAFNSKNYIKFFQQARKANFFMSCILNRYFNSFRIELLNIMRKAYTIPKSNSVVPYPACDIVEQFGFDDFDELYQFCENVGLKYDNDNIHIRRNFLIDDENIKRRSKVLVLDKMDTTPGRSIIGDSNRYSIQVELLPVHSSFNNENRLIFDSSTLSSSSNASSQIQPDNVITKSLPEIISPVAETKSDSNNPFNFMAFNKTNTEAVLPKFSFNTQVDKMSFKPLTENFKPGIFFNDPKTENTQNSTDDNLAPSTQFVFNLPNKILFPTITPTEEPVEETTSDDETPEEPTINYSILIDDIKHDLFEDIIELLIREQCERSIRQISKLRHRATQESFKLFDAFSQVITREIAAQVLDKEKIRKQLAIKTAKNWNEVLLAQHVQKTIKDIYVDLKLNNFKNRVSSIADTFFDQIYQDVLADVVRQVFRQELKVRDKQIETWRHNFIQHKFWCKWRKFYLLRQTFKFYRDTFPAAPTSGGTLLNTAFSRFHSTPNTVIDANIIKSNASLKRKLAYSKYNNIDEMKQYVRKRLNNRSSLNGKLSFVELPKRQYYLEGKYFKIWLNKVRKAKYRFVRSNFPAAPLTEISVRRSNQMLPGSFMTRTIIDSNIQRANSSIKQKLLRKLNCDYDSVSVIKRKLDEHEQRKIALEKDANANKSAMIRTTSDSEISLFQSSTSDYCFEPSPKRFHQSYSSLAVASNFANENRI